LGEFKHGVLVTSRARAGKAKAEGGNLAKEKGNAARQHFSLRSNMNETRPKAFLVVPDGRCRVQMALELG